MLLVRLQKDLPAGKTPGLPDSWPAEVEEVPDGTPDPKDGRLMMKDAAELEAYKLSLKDAYDTWKESVDLPAAKEAKFNAIDKRTEELIRAGFTYGGKTFSLSTNAQNTFTGLYAVRAEVVFQYPVRVNTINDLDYLELADADDVRDFYLTAVGTYRAHLDGGTALKDAVRDATTIAEVEAVKDGR